MTDLTLLTPGCQTPVALLHFHHWERCDNETHQTEDLLELHELESLHLNENWVTLSAEAV